MKVTINIGWLIFFGLVLIFAVHLLTDYFNEPTETVTIKHKKDFDIITLKLPNSHDPDIFGPPTWEARHFLAKWTPCPGCRAEAVSHEIFFHDWVNKKTGKGIKYKGNYDKWVKKICEENKS